MPYLKMAIGRHAKLQNTIDGQRPYACPYHRRAARNAFLCDSFDGATKRVHSDAPGVLVLEVCPESSLTDSGEVFMRSR
jgi:hypothetical protein